jgi:hypothetical protein
LYLNLTLAAHDSGNDFIFEGLLQHSLLYQAHALASKSAWLFPLDWWSIDEPLSRYRCQRAADREVMKRCRFSEHQIIATLKAVEAGGTVNAVRREYPISEATYYPPKAK